MEEPAPDIIRVEGDGDRCRARGRAPCRGLRRRPACPRSDTWKQCPCRCIAWAMSEAFVQPLYDHALAMLDADVLAPVPRRDR